MGRIEARLRELGVVLPPPFPPAANYVGAVLAGNLLQVAGHGPTDQTGVVFRGRVAQTSDIPRAKDAARLTALNLLAAAKAQIGDLDRVRRCIKLFGLVNCIPEFEALSSVMDGASDVMVSIFGEAGRHTRTTVGAPGLPVGILVELDGVFEIGP